MVEHPLCARELSIARYQCSDGSVFRQAMYRVGLHVCSVATQDLPLRSYTLRTPLEETTGYELAVRVIAVPILRAGLMFLEPMLQLLPTAQIGFIGLRRDEATLTAEEYYWRMPPIGDQTSVIVLDPMLATGGSAAAAIERLYAAGAQDITLACAIAAPEGVNRIASAYPNVRIVAAAIDRQLDERGFILPGLGDAGDRACGTE